MKKKNNKLDKIAFSVGDHTSRQSTDRESGEVNIKPPAFAKASPNFKEIKAVEPPSIKDQKKVIAENVIKEQNKKKQPEPEEDEDNEVEEEA